MTSSKTLPKGQIRNVPAPQGNKQSIYSRFIPREELNDFAAWTPGTIESAGDSPEQPHRSQRAEEPAVAAPNPHDELQAMLQANRQQAYQDGYRDGLVALEAFKQSHARQLSTQIGTLLQSTAEQIDELQQQMARALAVSASNLARQIVRSELQTNPDLVAMIATEALDTLLLSAKHITLRVHPDDQEVVQQGAADILAARGGRVITDSSVSRGGCLVESDIGTVDATMETRWRRAVAALGCDDAWQPTDAPEQGDGASPAAAPVERRK